MSFLDKLKKTVESGQAELATQMSRFQNRKFMEAVVAMCACVAMASDGVDGDEQEKMLAFIKDSPELKVFKADEVMDFFSQLIRSFEFDKDIGQGEAMKYILRVKDQPDEAQLVIRVGLAVARSSGELDAAETALLQEVADVLGVTLTL